jgi:hypothetical protein
MVCIFEKLKNGVQVQTESVYDIRDRDSEPQSFRPPPLLPHVCTQYTTFLTFTCTQVLWFLSRLTSPRVSGMTNIPTTRITIISTHTCNPVYVRSLDPSVLMFSLSLYRQPFIYILFRSDFTSHEKKRTELLLKLFNQ